MKCVPKVGKRNGIGIIQIIPVSYTHLYPTYKSCYNCSEWLKNKWGSVWFKEVFVKNTLKVNEAKELWQDFFINTQRSIRLFSYVNGTLTVSEIRRVLNVLKKEGFEPELILIDYVDIMESEKEREQRHKENEKWKGLRSISQEFDALVITPTQTAVSYTHLEKFIRLEAAIERSQSKRQRTRSGYSGSSKLTYKQSKTV